MENEISRLKNTNNKKLNFLPKMSTGEPRKLHILFFPLMAHSHMRSTIEMAKLFASRGCKTSVILTHANAALFTESIQRSRSLGLDIETLLVHFPSEEVGLPRGCEDIASIRSVKEVQDKSQKFYAATALLERPVGDLVAELRPDCLVADALFPWATRVAAGLGIPRLAFEGTSFFASCAEACLTEHGPHRKASSDSEPFVIPTLPHKIEFTRDHVPSYMKEDEEEEEESEMACLARKVDEATRRCFGVIVNSFYELEPDYADHYRRVLGRKAWHVGPISFVNDSDRGPKSSIPINNNNQTCLRWLDSKEPNSVVYVSFGSVANPKDEQLMEIATGLEASGKQFMWVVKKEKKEEEEEEWLPKGFEERTKGRGMIIRGWAPQAMILDHEAIGGFVTHCGWNSVLEGICGGVPMVTWPVSAEQFYNEKFVTQVLGIGVEVGSKKWGGFSMEERVKSGAVEKAVRRLMEGEEAEGMRIKAKELSGMARKAFEEGGSSYNDLDALMEELRSIKCNHCVL